MITSVKDYKVLNYSSSPVAVKGQSRSYLIGGAVGETPGMEYMDIKEIDYISSRSPVFKTGMLEFEESEREDIYKAIKLHDWKDSVFLEREIDEMLLNPTKEILDKILGIRNIGTFERIRGHMVGLVNSNYDVSNRVITLVEARYKELNSNPIAPTKIKIEKKDDIQSSDSEVEQLKLELENTKMLLEKMMKNLNAGTDEPKESNTSTDTKPLTKSKRQTKPQKSE